jgi:hypothetical protein
VEAVEAVEAVKTVEAVEAVSRRDSPSPPLTVCWNYQLRWLLKQRETKTKTKNRNGKKTKRERKGKRKRNIGIRRWSQPQQIFCGPMREASPTW